MAVLCLLRLAGGNLCGRALLRRRSGAALSASAQRVGALNAAIEQPGLPSTSSGHASLFLCDADWFGQAVAHKGRDPHSQAEARASLQVPAEAPMQ